MLPKTAVAVLILLPFIHEIFGQEICFTTDQSNQRTSCVFPFILNDEIYYGCTTDSDPDSNLWCSTKTDPQTHKHVSGQGHWGYCKSSECPADIQFHEKNQLALEIQPVLTEILNKTTSNCPCVKVDDCQLNKKPLEAAFKLAGHPLGMKINQLFCDSSQRKMFCCDNSQNIPAEDLGTWQPDGKKEECGLKTKYSNIVGGESALPGEFPYMALLGYESGSRKLLYLCGGSVINKWYILTAAHCVSGRSGTPVEIVLGEYDTSKDPDCNALGNACEAPVLRYAISKITAHKSYDRRTLLNDIALIRVDQKIPLYYREGNSNVIPVCLPWKETDDGRKLLAGDDLIVTGWGRTTNDNRKETVKVIQDQVSSTVLQKARIPAVGRITCDNEELFKNLNTTTHICAGGVKGVDSCKGDSGGPLVYKKGVDSPWYQVGIVSYGTRICGFGLPGIYSRVSFYIPWIIENMEP